MNDPTEHSKRQVAELDHTAKRSKEKKRIMQEQVEADTKEIARIDEQLAAIHRIYDPLVAGLAEKQAKKANLIALLEKCKSQEKAMMGTMKGMVNENVVRSYKQNRNLASYKLEMERGFTVKTESTFRQSGGRGNPNPNPVSLIRK